MYTNVKSFYTNVSTLQSGKLEKKAYNVACIHSFWESPKLFDGLDGRIVG